jgi:hypothetical protein
MSVISESRISKYRQAVLTVAWTVQNGYRELIFASVELVPIYLGNQRSIEEIGVKVGKRRLYYKRHVLSAKDGVDWYRKAHQNERLSMAWQPETEINLRPKGESVPSFVISPRWPDTLYSDNFPFRARYGQGVHVSHFRPTDDLRSLMDFISNADVSEWISSRLMWPLNENLEYLGSVNLVIPNPFYCHSRMRLIPASDTNGRESVSVYFDRDCSSDELTLILQERINKCLAPVRQFQIKGTQMKIDLMALSDEVGYYVVDKSGTVIDRQDFAPFLRKIVVGYDVVSSTEEFRCKDGKVQCCSKSSHLEQQLKDESEKLPEMVLHDRLATMAYARDLKYKTKELYVYKPNHGADAERRIREIINKANRNLVIIDPYCSSATAEMYFRAINHGVKLSVYCTHKGFDSNKTAVSMKDDGMRLNTFINQHVNTKAQVYVWICNESSLHDRFIIVDDEEVWMLGSSMITIGNSLSVIVRLENGPAVIKELYSFIASCDKISLKEYLERGVDRG